MKYEFGFKDQKYHGKYEMWSNTNKVGDSILIKFAINKPKLNEVQ